MANRKPLLYALLAALCYGISAPVSKLLLAEAPPVFMASLLYIGAGAGMGIIGLARGPQPRETRLGKKELPYTAAMVALDILAPILLMLGLASTTAATAALLNNFEIVATAVIALVFFKESVPKKMWIAIAFIVAASILLTVEDFTSLSFSTGSVFILLACVCWGIENNCTRALSAKDPLQIVVVKGLGSGLGALCIALVFFKEAVPKMMWIAIAFIVAASILLTVQDFTSLSFSTGAVLILLACVCWGIENNCTRALSDKDPLQIVVVKGLGSGLGALCIALAAGESLPPTRVIVIALFLGFVAYGLSITFYILAQRHLGAARTSAFYAFAPFIGAGISFAIFREMPTILYGIALALMCAGAYFASSEKHRHWHTHQAIAHEHAHRHDDGHHSHTHENPADGEHIHTHTHTGQRHRHAHSHDLHHLHAP